MARWFLSTFALCLFLVNTVSTSSCNNPKVSVSSTFSTQDATILTQLAYVGEFSLKCSSGSSPNLFAEFPCGRIVPVARTGEDKYQISWTEETKKGKTGNIAIRLFNEEGYANIRKAQRDGERVSDVKALAEITLSTKSAYKGPWVNAELIAAALVGGVAYFAMTTKNKMQA